MGHVLAVPGQAIQKSNLHINGQMDIVICKGEIRKPSGFVTVPSGFRD